MSRRPLVVISILTYAVLIAAFWEAAQFFRVLRNVPRAATVISFALIFAPYWFFGFSAAEPLRRALRWPGLRVFAAGALVLPYVAFAVGAHVFRWQMALGLFAIPVIVAALLESIPQTETKARLAWQDIAAFALIAAPVLYAWFRPGWPFIGLGSFPKLLFTDVALYGFLVCR